MNKIFFLIPAEAKRRMAKKGRSIISLIKLSAMGWDTKRSQTSQLHSLHFSIQPNKKINNNNWKNHLKHYMSVPEVPAARLAFANAGIGLPSAGGGGFHRPGAGKWRRSIRNDAHNPCYSCKRRRRQPGGRENHQN